MKRTSNVFHILVAGVVALAFTTGCGFQSAPVTKSAPVAGAMAVSIHGIAHGGQQPLIGAHVYLYAVGTGGYGTASTSLLLPGLNTAADGSGQYYTTTDSSGAFSVTGDYLCTAGKQVYLYVSGGDPQLGSGSNTAIGLMAGLGECPATGTLALTVPQVVVNEVSTVVMAYAFAGFAIDGQHIASSSTTLAATGVANAMSTALNIVSVASGLISPTTAVGNGVAPVQTVYALANVLATCINSSGITSNACTQLQKLTGAATTADTAAVALDIAHAPFNNVSSLYNLGSATGPFQPAASSTPADFTVSVHYLPAISQAGTEFFYSNLAIDAAGKVWSVGGNDGNNADSTYTVLTAYSPVGAVVVNQTISTAVVGAVRIDASGDAWVLGGPDNTTGYFYKYSNQGAPLSPTGGYTCSGMQSLDDIAFDGSGDAYISDYEVAANDVISLTIWQVSQGNGACLGGDNLGANTEGGSTVQVDSLGEVLTEDELHQTYYNFGSTFGSPTTFAGPQGTSDFALDAANHLWSNLGTEYSTTGTLLSPAGGYSFGLSSAISSEVGGGVGGPPAIDGAGAVWQTFFIESSSIYSIFAGITNAGVPITPSSGVPASPYYNDLDAFTSLAIDGSGNIWNQGEIGDLLEYIGLATPVATPVLLNQLGTRP